MASFVSTTRDYQVATMFAGNGEKPANFELVIFEIRIEQSDLEEERRPFADISEVSSKEDEAEILLCMGTVMRVESVELGEEMTRIRLRTCSYDDSAWQFYKVVILPYESLIPVDETFSLVALGRFLLNIGEYKKSEQFLHMIKSSIHPLINKAIQLHSTFARTMQMKRHNSDDTSNTLIELHEYQKLYQSIANDELAPDLFREINKFQAQFAATCLDTINSTGIGSLNESMLLKIHNGMLEKLKKDGPEFTAPSIHPSLSKPVRLFPEIAKSSDEQMKSTVYDILKFDIDNMVLKKDSSRSFTLLDMAMTAKEEGNYDRAIALVRDALSATCDYDIHVLLYEFLIILYTMQKNWPAVIESCQCIIDMPEIPPSSSAIVKAHIERGNACMKLDDLSEAFLSYTNALELQNQHHISNHPLTSEIHIKIGNVFEQLEDASAALEWYNKTIAFGFPDTASEAYEMIGIIYTRQGNYDMARSNFIKCLEIQEGSIPHKTFRLACTHMRLALVEHKTEHYQQRDFHIQQARKIDIHDEEKRDFITKQISQILGEVIPTTS